MSDILTKKGRLALFENNIVIDKKLLKWRRAEYGLEKTSVEDKKNESNLNAPIQLYSIPSDPDSISLEEQIRNTDVDSEVGITTKFLPLYEIAEGIRFDEIAKSGIKDLTRLIAEKKLKFVIGGYGSLGRPSESDSLSNAFIVDSVSDIVLGNNDPFEDEMPKRKKKISFFNKILNSLKNKYNESKNKEIVIDALQFFSLVKASSKASVETYRNRVSDYLKAIHNASSCGQTALVEDLLRGLVTNKYESVLYAEKYYYVVTEEQMVSFVKNCEKGIKLDYIKNFTRPLPQTVVDKINKLNELEVFDNYVVLYYDPEGKVYKETAREEAKRKDPIIFGVIAGSTKLYYVDDWVDEYCDLTLEKFIDAIGVSKEELHIDKK